MGGFARVVTAILPNVELLELPELPELPELLD
jgi:hypothetical protein